MDDKYTKAREIVEVFDDFLNDKLVNRGIELMIARKHEIPPQKVESSIRSAICEINKEMGMHFTPMTYIHVVALGEKYRKKMVKAK